MEMKISRRNFVKGSAALAAGMAFAGLTGCSAGTGAGSEAGKPLHVKVACFSPTEGTKNAAAMLFLSQGVPMLMAGDEDCNSQQGNNNAYCQDNSIGWKDWKSSRSSKEFFRYIRSFIQFRKEHAILRMEQPMRLSDAKSAGYPDLSYHEENAWITPQHFNRKAIGVLYCGKYAGEAEDVFIGFNFCNFPKKLALPKQRGRRKWYLAMDTVGKESFLEEQEEVKESWYSLEPHSVCIIIGK